MRRYFSTVMVLLGVTILITVGFLLLDTAEARTAYGTYYRDQMRGYRFAIMAISTGAGFLLGWFCSPAAKDFRFIVMVGGGLLAVFIAIGSDGLLAWGLTWLVAVVGFSAALGYWLGRGVKALAAIPTTFGSSQWATLPHLFDKGIISKTGLRLGTISDGHTDHPIRYNGDRHALTVAPTRSGKGVAHVIPNLLTYQGSVLTIDPKGENAMITAHAREAMGQEIHIVDPWGIAQNERSFPSRFNPLDWLKPGDIDIAENAMLLADAIIVKDSHATGGQFWDEEAKAYLQGMILFVATDEEERHRRHLGTVRDLLLLDGENLTKLYRHMMTSPHHIVASTGARCLQKDPKLLSNVLASVQSHTHFLDSARIRESMAVSDFSFEDLKTKPMTIYLVLPADRLSSFGRFLRLLVQQAITVNARNIAAKPDKPVLFILDELPALGRLTMVEQAYGLMAGFGLQLWGIVQDLGQLKHIYGDARESFIANSGVVSYFGSPDSVSAEYFSSLCGVRP